jgi:ATPase subunit of ABC transporter with duplicated ATPase domains
MFENYDERFSKIERVLRSLNFRKNRDPKPIHIVGGGNGSGKMHSIKTVLDQMDEEYIIINTNEATPTSFYMTLYEYSDSDTIVVIDEMCNNSSTNNQARINKTIAQLCKGEMITHPYPNAPNPPNTILQFEFKGRVILSTADLTNTRDISGLYDKNLNTIFLGFS